jgi:hypothetical protein
MQRVQIIWQCSDAAGAAIANAAPGSVDDDDDDDDSSLKRIK